MTKLYILHTFCLCLRSDTPPHRMREGGLGPIQQPSSSCATSNQTPPPVGTQVGAQGGSHHPHHYMGGRGTYSNFPDQGARMTPHQQHRAGDRGNQQHGFAHQDEGPPRGPQQGQIWGTPHAHYDRNGRADLPVDSSSHLHHHHSHHPQQTHFPLHTHKQENSRDRVVEAPAKKTDSSPPLNQPSLSSSCSSSSSSSSAREDGSVTVALHHHPSQREVEAGIGHSLGERGNSGNAGSNSHVKHDKTGPVCAPRSSVASSPPPSQHGSHTQPQQQQHPHPKSNQRGGREHKTETQWGPRPGSSNTGGGSSHSRRANNAGGGNNSRGGEDSTNPSSDHKPSNQTGGTNANKRAGPIKKPVLKEIKREGGEVDGEKSNPGFGKDKEQEGGHLASMKQDGSSISQNTSASAKDEPPQTVKPRNGGKERSSGGGSGRGPKDVDTTSSGFSGPSSRKDRDRSFERGGNTSHHHGVPTKGSRASRGRGGEFYGRGRGYRGTYTVGAGPTGSSRGRMSGRSGRDYRTSVGGGQHQESKAEGGSGRHGQDRSQHNPARARNRSETRSEGSEYEEIPKRRRERGSETGSESGASDLGHSDKEDHQKPNTKNGTDNANTSGSGNMSSAPPRGSQTRVFTPRGVPSRRGRGGGSGGGGGGNMYRGSGNVGGPPGGHRVGPSSGSHGGSSKSSASARKQQGPPQTPGPKDLGRGGNGGEKKDKIADTSPSQGTTLPQPSLPTTTPNTHSSENGGVVTQQVSSNASSNSGGPNALPLPTNRGFPPSGFERGPRRRRHGRSQHQQDKPPRFRRLKERENAARINGGVGVIGGQRSSSPSLNSVQDSNGAPVSAHVSANAQNANHNATLTTNNNSGGGHLVNANSHHHHHYSQGNAGPPHPQHHHSHGAKSPDFTNQNSDQANEEWETASESSDFTEFRDRERGGGKSFSSHHHHHLGRGGGGSGGGGVVERDMTGKEPLANKRSFSSQRPGMERQNRRVNTGGAGGGGGGRGPRGPPGGGSGGPGNGGGNRGEKRGNWPSPKNRK